MENQTQIFQSLTRPKRWLLRISHFIIIIAALLPVLALGLLETVLAAVLCIPQGKDLTFPYFWYITMEGQRHRSVKFEILEERLEEVLLANYQEEMIAEKSDNSDVGNLSEVEGKIKKLLEQYHAAVPGKKVSRIGPEQMIRILRKPNLMKTDGIFKHYLYFFVNKEKNQAASVFIFAKEQLIWAHTLDNEFAEDWTDYYSWSAARMLNGEKEINGWIKDLSSPHPTIRKSAKNELHHHCYHLNKFLRMGDRAQRRDAALDICKIASSPEGYVACGDYLKESGEVLGQLIRTGADDISCRLYVKTLGKLGVYAKPSVADISVFLDLYPIPQVKRDKLGFLKAHQQRVDPHLTKLTLNTLEKLGHTASDAVPFIINLLEQELQLILLEDSIEKEEVYGDTRISKKELSDKRVRKLVKAMQALGNMGPSGEPALPILYGIQHDRREKIRKVARNTIMQIESSLP